MSATPLLTPKHRKFFNAHSRPVRQRLSGKAMARTGLRMMPTFPLPSLKFRTAGFPQYGFKAGRSTSAPSTRSKNTMGPKSRMLDQYRTALHDPERVDLELTVTGHISRISVFFGVIHEPGQCRI